MMLDERHRGGRDGRADMFGCTPGGIGAAIDTTGRVHMTQGSERATSAARRFAVRAARRTLRSLEPGDAQAAAGSSATAEGVDPQVARRLARLYNRVRQWSNTPLDLAPSIDPDTELPPIDAVDAVEAAARVRLAEGLLIDGVFRDGDLEAGITAAVRELMDMRAGRWRARAIGRTAGSAGIGNLGVICRAMIQTALPDKAAAWPMFAEVERAEALRLAAPEYLLAAVEAGAADASALVESVLDGAVDAPMTARGWLALARWAFVAGEEDLARRMYDAGAAAAADLVDRGPARAIEHDMDTLQPWYGRRTTAVAPAPPGTVDFALVDGKQPNVGRASADFGDVYDTLGVVAHLARRTGLDVRGDADLAAVVAAVRADVPADRVRRTPTGSVRLHTADRGASTWAVVPPGTWTVVHGALGDILWGYRRDFPTDARLRPLYWSVQIATTTVLTPAAVEHLRACAPIGCRDLTSALLLTAAGVPAFLSGELAVAAADIAPSRSNGPRFLWVDVPPEGPGRFERQVVPAVRTRPLAENLRAGVDRIGAYRDATTVTTGRASTYVVARAGGTDVDFRPGADPEAELDERAPLTDAALTNVRKAQADVLDPVLDAVFSGAGEDDVRSLWRRLAAPLVARVTDRLADIPPVPLAGLDLDAAIASVHDRSVVMERTQPAPAGDEIAVELSLDQNYRHQLGVVLQSILARASRPIRAYVLCRGLTDADRSAFATAFPTVSFVWMPTDDVDYGADINLLAHITVSTMDRLLLPLLLPGVHRIIHHDLDAASVGDLAELADLDLGGHALAARRDPFPFMPDGYQAFISSARRLGWQPERARELLLRIAARHPFDFDIFNAGVMVLDLERMRQDRFTEQWVAFAIRFGLHDQETLIAYAGRERAQLPDAWNTVPGVEAIEGAKLLHWAGRVKPWTGGIWAPGKAVWTGYEELLAERVAAAGLPPV